MAFTAGATAQGTYGSTGNTVDITVGATSRLLVLVLFVNGNAARTGGAPTWSIGSQTFTDSGRGFVVHTECGAEVWYLIDPGTGSGTVTVPNTGAVSMDISAMSFIPATGGCAVDVANSATGETQNPSLTLTSVAANALIVGGLGSGDRDDATAGANYTLIHTFDAGNQTWGSERWLDAGVAGNKTVSFGTARDDDWGLIGISFKETVATRTVSESDGITIGESKTIAPLVLADVSLSDGIALADTLVGLEVVSGAEPDRDITGISDDVTVGEAITAELDDHELDITDGLTVGEAITAQMQDMTVDVADSLTIGDVPSVAFELIPFAVNLGVDNLSVWKQGVVIYDG